ncbi:hypothetical protein Trydic_g1484 [Trypoxylus dichotomus]
MDNKSKKRQPGAHWCAVSVCKNNTNSNKKYSFFKFPKEKERVLQWIDRCNRPDLLEKNLERIWKSTFVCGKHFENHMFLNDLKNRLQPHAIPSLFLAKSYASLAPIESNKPASSARILETITLPANPKTEIIQSTMSLNGAEVGESFTGSIATQSENTLSTYSPKKEILRKTLTCSRKPKLKLEKTPIPSTGTLQDFFNLCDKFLTPELATIVKFHARVKARKVV